MEKWTMSNLRTYKELQQLQTFDERFAYLQLHGHIGKETFGYDRYLNQQFYRSKEWKDIRRIVILRDHGCDLGIMDRTITGRIYIHHMNPITREDLINGSDLVLNPNYLICVSSMTHEAIHYGDKDLLISDYVERSPYDTCPWRQ